MSFRSNYHIFAQWKKKQQYQKFTVGISYLLLCISSSLHLSINEDHNTHRWKSKHWKSARDSSQRKIKTITKINTKKNHTRLTSFRRIHHPNCLLLRLVHEHMLWLHDDCLRIQWFWPRFHRQFDPICQALLEYVPR